MKSKDKQAEADKAEVAEEAPVFLSIEEEGLPVIVINLDAELTLARSKDVRASVKSQVEALEGRSFSLLMDTRAVTSVEDGALDELQQTEKDAAGLGLEKIAHVVRFPEMKEQLAATYRELGYPDLIGTFTDRDEAFGFLRG